MNMIVSASAISAATLAPAIASTSADPIFAAIERCRAAEAAALIEANAKQPRDVRPAREALARTAPTTPEGLAALAAFLKEQTVEFGEFYFEGEDEELSEQIQFAKTLAFATQAMIGREPWKAYVSPIDHAADAETIALGKEFMALFSKWIPIHARHVLTGRAAHELAGSRYHGNSGDEAALSELGRASDETGFTEAWRAANEIGKKIEPLVKRIMALPSQTDDAFELKAFCIMYSGWAWWAQSEIEDDYPEILSRQMAESVVRSSGGQWMLQAFKDMTATLTKDDDAAPASDA